LGNGKPTGDAVMNTTSSDDATLVSLCIQERSNAAFPRELIDRYGRLVMQTITWTFRRFSSDVREDVEDVFQEVFVSLFRDNGGALLRFDPSRASLGTYLCTIARNATINAVKRKKHDSDEDVDAIGEDSLNPEMLMEKKDARERIEALLPSLSAKERFFFRLYFDDCMPPEEIAGVLHVSIDTVYSKKAKIQEKIRHLFPQTIEKG
jgi:RNA polymerase sigma-70 factor, ECF subfamily